MMMGGRADEGLRLCVCVDCGQWGKEAHAWPQLPLRKLSRQLSRTYSSLAPSTQRPAFTTLGNFLCCFTVVTSLQLACTLALLGRGTATCHNPKAWRQGEREFKDLCNLYTVVSMGHNVWACRRQTIWRLFGLKGKSKSYWHVKEKLFFKLAIRNKEILMLKVLMSTDIKNNIAIKCFAISQFCPVNCRWK